MLNQRQKEMVKATVPVLKENGVALTDYFYQRMLKNNPQLKETFNLGHQRSGAQAKALAGAVLAYAENIDDPSVLAPVIELICHKHVSLNIQAPDYSIVGENLLHSISEVLHIPMEDELIAAWGAAYWALADLFIKTEQEMYASHTKTEGSWLGWRRFIVSKKVKETDEVTSFYLTPEDGKAIPAYQAGQYVSVRVYIPEIGLKQPRQYSLSDIPASDHFRISVKKENPKAEGQDPGYVSSTLHQHIQEKDVIELSAPTGNFTLAPQSDKPTVLVSGGIGLTPMITMLKQSLMNNANSKTPVHFIYAARNSSVHPLKDELKALTNKYDNLHVHINYNEVNSHDVQGLDYHMAGHLNLKALDKQWLPHNAEYYLCGPIPFMQQQNQALLDLGITAHQIHSEAFGTGGTAL